MRVHVLGAGRMGLPMARHLREGGHALSVSDPDGERLRLARGPDAITVSCAASAMWLLPDTVARRCRTPASAQAFAACAEAVGDTVLVSIQVVPRRACRAN